MKVVVDIIWGMLVIASLGFFVASFKYGLNSFSIGMMFAGMASVINMAEKHRDFLNRQNKNRFK